MAVITDPKSSFDFAYKGFQYPLPPSWKYAIRQQDQIYWLLQALMLLNEHALNECELSDAINDVLRYVNCQDARLSSRIDALLCGKARWRNPVTGMYDYGYTITKQMYDMLRVYAITWDEIKATGMTWNELKDSGHTWFEVDMFSNLYWGDGKIRAKYTPAEHIDEQCPGYWDCKCPETGEGGELEPATPTRLGGVKIGDGITVDADGTINVDFTTARLPVASKTQRGVVIVGGGIDVNLDGVISVDGSTPTPDPEPEPPASGIGTTWGELKAFGFEYGNPTSPTKGTTWNELKTNGFLYDNDGTPTTGGTWDDVKNHGFLVMEVSNV